MPALLDHAVRRTEIAEAVWRVVRRDGVGAASVRDVAAEAGLSTGSLRHVFPTKSALLAHAMQLVHERAAARIEAVPRDLEPQAYALRVLSELLPLDANRRAELEVDVALVAEAPAQPELRAINDAAHQAMGALARTLVASLREVGQVHPDRDVELEGDRLAALVDGLALNLLVDGSFVTPARATTILDRHLRELECPPV